jgi:hypothetical protein
MSGSARPDDPQELECLYAVGKITYDQYAQRGGGSSRVAPVSAPGSPSAPARMSRKKELVVGFCVALAAVGIAVAVLQQGGMIQFGKTSAVATDDTPDPGAAADNGSSGAESDSAELLEVPDDEAHLLDEESVDHEGGEVFYSFSADALEAIARNGPWSQIRVDVYEPDGSIRSACDISWDIFAAMATDGHTWTQPEIDAEFGAGGTARMMFSRLTDNDVEAVGTAIACAQQFVGRTT